MTDRTRNENGDPSSESIDDPQSSVSSLQTVVQKYQLLSFILITFGWTFGIYGVLFAALNTIPSIGSIPAAWGPLIGAAVVTWMSGGSLREWAGQVTNWRVKPRWYLIAFLLPLLITEASNLVYVFGGVSLTVTDIPFHLFVLNFFVVLLLAGSLEEFGWRGFAQPRLQERYSALIAGLVVGLLWAVWHYPHFIYGSPWTQDISITLYTLRVMGTALVFAWVYNGTGGSILLVMIIHAMGNLPAIFEPAGEVSATLEAITYPITILTYALIAFIVVRLHGTEYLAADKPDPSIPGAPNDETGSKQP